MILKLSKNIHFFIWICILIFLTYGIHNYNQCRYRLPWTYFLIAFLFYTLLISQYLVSIYKHHIPPYLPVILLFVLLFVINLTNKTSKIRYLAFLVWFICLCIIFNPIFELAQTVKILYPIVFTVICIFTILSIFAIKKPYLISLNMGNYLLISLIGLIALNISFWFFKPSTFTLRLTSYIGIIIFCGLILYDTKKLKVDANKCKKPFDYINHIISLFLDIINLFSELVMAKSLENT